MSIVEDLLDWWRTRHERGECGEIERTEARTCPFCEAERTGRPLEDLLES